MKKGISFVTAADDGYHEGLSALLKSFTISNKDLAPLNLNVMDCGLKQSFKGELSLEMREFSKKQEIDLTCRFLEVNLKRWHPFPPHWDSYAAYAFIEAIDLVETRFLVFADADMLHFKSLRSTVEKLEGSGRMIAGVVDQDYNTLGNDFYVNHLSPLQAEEKELPYLNSGYMVFDRTRFSFSRFLEFLQDLNPEKAHERFKGVKKFKHDQTLLNTFIKGDCLLLDESFNYFCKDNSRFKHLSDRKNFHFISNPKPWNEGGFSEVARETVFRTAEAILNGKSLPELKNYASSSAGSWMKKLFYKFLGKNKKLTRLEESQITSPELQALQKTIASWCQ